MTTETSPIRTCPGWSGNGNNCGRGAPRVLREGETMCKNCTDAARRAGQRTEEEERHERELREKRLAAATRGAALVLERAGQPIAGHPGAWLGAIVLELGKLFEDEVEPHGYGYSTHHRISASRALDVLRRVAGLELEEKERW